MQFWLSGLHSSVVFSSLGFSVRGFYLGRVVEVDFSLLSNLK